MLLKMETEPANALTSGDEEAVARFVAEHAPRLLQAARRLLVCEEDARDAVQDAFVSAIRSIDSFDGRSQLSTWLHRIVVNAALMRLRARRRRPDVSIEALLPAFYADGPRVEPRRAWTSTAGELLERRETRNYRMNTEPFWSFATSKAWTPGRPPSTSGRARAPSRRGCTAPGPPCGPCWKKRCWGMTPNEASCLRGSCVATPRRRLSLGHGAGERRT